MGDAEEYRKSETRRAILRVLEQSNEPLGPQDIADALGEENNTVRQRLYHMSKDGEVKVVARGLYALHNNHFNHINEDAEVRKLWMLWTLVTSAKTLPPLPASTVSLAAKAATCVTRTTHTDRSKEERGEEGRGQKE